MKAEDLITIMLDPEIHRTAWKVARRFTNCREDQEEYVNDAWLRLSEVPENKSNEYYKKEIYRAINASRMRKSRANSYCVHTNVHSTSERVTEIPSGMIHLYDSKYLNPKAGEYASWYYPGEWEDYGVDKDSMQVRTLYDIIVVE